MASYFCPCPRGMEAALAEELGEIALLSDTFKVHNQVPGGVHCSGALQDAYRVNLHSRIASRVLMRMGHASYANENDIYDLVMEQKWEDWFDVDHTIRVDVTAVKSPLRSLEWVETFLAGLTDEGFSDVAAVAAYRAFTSFLLGHLLLEVSVLGADVGPLDVVEEETEPRGDELRSFPTVTRLQPMLSEDHSAVEFEESLEDLLNRMALIKQQNQS